MSPKLKIIAFTFASKKFPVFKTRTFYSVIIFILLSFFAGKALRFYFIVPRWDKILHFLSGFIIVWAGKDVYIKLKGDTQNRWLMNAFALITAIAIAGVWEMVEFSGDTLFGFSSQNGSLSDSMIDMIYCSVSAVTAVIF